MGYRSLKECCLDLERNGHLVRVREPVSPHLEMAEIQRRAYAAEAPALFFEKVEGCRFPAVCNLFGTEARCHFLFRDTLERVAKIIRLKADPASFWRSPWTFASSPFTAVRSLPRKVGRGPVLSASCRIDELPQIQSWPDDGGPFITLPQVFSEHPEHPGILHSNLGMYRVQLGGNRYQAGAEVGLHYQIHRGIGAHHAAALQRDEALPVSVFVGGPPSHTFAAVLPLPEGLSELLFAGMLGGRRFRYTRKGRHVISTESDFCLTGSIRPGRTLPEGPFGDHLGYYSLTHDFPVLEVDKVYHRRDAIWPFTVVGRPPQEDTSFGRLIHEITKPLVPREIPGVKALHAVDAAGVHPLLLAVAAERYVPYAERAPRELLTHANAILGFGQCSLAKYLWIAAEEDSPTPDVHDIEGFLRHVLERLDLERDLHFHTRTTIDTLDYSGTGLNAGSKLVLAAAGPPRRELARALPPGLPLPSGFRNARLALRGTAVLEGPPFRADTAAREIGSLTRALEGRPELAGLPLLVLVEDADFTARNLENFLWTTFTRSNPSHDVHGVGSFTEHKHWGCREAIVIDARLKPHHAPPLLEDPEVTRRVDALSTPGKSLHGVL